MAVQNHKKRKKEKEKSKYRHQDQQICCKFHGESSQVPDFFKSPMENQ